MIQSSYDELIKQVEKNRIKIDNWDDNYEKRLNYELEIIENKGFEDYFLILQSSVQWARDNGILVGPGRGSSAGSLVAFLLGITMIDPLKYDLMFERFLNPSRPDLPDIDVDFQASRRGEVFDQIRATYGDGNTCFISTFSKFHAKQAIRDLCRIFDIPMKTAAKLGSAVPNNVKTMDDAMKIREVSDFMERNPEIYNLSRRLEGAIRQRSIHPAGIIITPGPLSNYIAIEKVKGEHCSCFDMDAIDYLGLLKIDVLSLRTLDVIARALELTGLKYTDLPLDPTDDKVFNIFREGLTLGVFQFESSLLTGMSKKLQISDFKTLYAATTIARPGPLHSGETKKYIKRHLGEARVEYLTPELEPITSETYGLLLYQEQTMKVAVQLAGFSEAESETLRKIIGKSKGKGVMDEYRDKFISGCIDNGIKQKLADKLWSILRESSKYSFNKSHAVAYSLVSYWCAWLKAYHPKEFLVALMEFESDDIQGNATRELRELGYSVLPPDINRSEGSVRISDDGEIYMGLSDVAGVGEKAVEEILANQPFRSFDDFMGRVQKRRANSRVVRNLIQAGAFDSFSRRDVLFYTLDDEPYQEWDDEEMIKRQMMVLDMPASTPLIDHYDNPYERQVNITPIRDIDFTEKIPDVWVKGILLDFSKRKSANTKLQDFFGEVHQMGYFYVDDGTKKTECFIAPEQLVLYEESIVEGDPVLLKCHTYGKTEKLYVDAVVNLHLLDKINPTLKEYLEDRRELKVENVPIGNYHVDVISSANYQTSKNGKNYARILFESGEEGLCFNLTRDIFRTGEILCWRSNKKPFVNIVKRIL